MSRDNSKKLWVIQRFNYGMSAEDIWVEVLGVGPCSIAYGLSWSYLVRIIREYKKEIDNGKK